MMLLASVVLQVIGLVRLSHCAEGVYHMPPTPALHHHVGRLGALFVHGCDLVSHLVALLHPHMSFTSLALPSVMFIQFLLHA